MGQIDGRRHDKGGKEETNVGVERSVGGIQYKEKTSKGNAREVQKRK